MKTAVQQLNETALTFTNGLFVDGTTDIINLNAVCKAMEEYSKISYNKAIDDVIKIFDSYVYKNDTLAKIVLKEVKALKKDIKITR